MGELSKKIIKDYHKQGLNKVINLSEVKSAKESLAKFNSEIEDMFELLIDDPSRNIYMMTQNILSYFAEETSIFKGFEEYYDTFVKIEEAYMPSFPPMSPITNSYFAFWTHCDLKFGKDKETMGSILYDLGLEFDFEEIVMNALENFNQSYMGFYTHIGFDGDLVILKEFFTEKIAYCTSPSGYRGKKNEIWYVRLVQNLDKVFNYSIPLTTPYVLLNSSQKDWDAFFKRQGITKENHTKEDRLYHFLKNNSKLSYWLDYIMDGYANYNPSCVFLTGIPDIEKSLPNHINNSFF